MDKGKGKERTEEIDLALWSRRGLPLWVKVNLGAVVGLGVALFLMLGALDWVRGEAWRRFALSVFLGAPFLGASSVYFVHRKRALGGGVAAWLAAGAGAGGLTGAFLADLGLISVWAVGVGVVVATVLGGLGSLVIRGTSAHGPSEVGGSNEDGRLEDGGLR